MEPNITLARWDAASERMDVWTSSQSPWFVADEIANVCGIKADRVACHDVSTGGGFGSKSHISEHEVLAAALSIQAGRPVLLALDRTEEFSATKPRHLFRIEATIHADEHAQICLFEAALDVDNGAYNHYGPSVMVAGAKKFGAIYRPLGVRTVTRLIARTERRAASSVATAVRRRCSPSSRSSTTSPNAAASIRSSSDDRTPTSPTP